MRKGWLVILFAVLFLASSYGLSALESSSAEAGLHSANATKNTKDEKKNKKKKKAPTELKKSKTGTKNRTRTTTRTTTRSTAHGQSRTRTTTRTTTHSTTRGTVRRDTRPPHAADRHNKPPHGRSSAHHGPGDRGTHHRRDRYVNQRRQHRFIHDRRGGLHHPPKYYHYHYYNRRFARSYHPYYNFDSYMVHVWGPSWRARFRYYPSWRFAPLASLVYFSTYFTRNFDRPYRVTRDGDHLFVHPWEVAVAGYYYDTVWNRWVVIDGHGRQFYFDTFEDGIEELPPTIVISGWYVSGGTYIYY